MATAKDTDNAVSLWLHNKLGTSNDTWTSGSICSQLNSVVLSSIKKCFSDLQTQVKLKLLLSFFHIPRRNVDEWRSELEEIIKTAQEDSELWVFMLAEMMKTFPASGSLNTVITENEQNRRIFSDLVQDLKRLVRKQSESTMLPLECHYLNKSALNALVGQQPAQVKHFTLKRKPKSAALRAELLQKSVDAASNVKKSTAPTVPVRSRAMPRKMTDTTPLKGIPSQVPSSMGPSRPSLPRNPTPRKDGGIKLLDINEQPIAFAQAKKRKKLQEIEENAKKTAEVAAAPSTTPDYAAGLVPLLSVAPATPAPLQPPDTPATPSYTPTPNPSTPIMPPIPNPPQPEVIEPRVEEKPAPTPPPPQPKNTMVAVQKPGEEKRQLTLSRDQVVAAQEIFRTANTVSRPEKALILGFIAGLRQNPCPDLGNIVTVKLSEDTERIVENNIAITRVVETHFQMNYCNGEWKTLKKYRDQEMS